MAHRYMNWFRKHQKVVLAFLGVVCIITFTVGSSLSLILDWQRSSAASQDPVVVTWTKGSVHESELHLLRQRHNVTCLFLENVIRETVGRGGTPVINGQPVRKDQPLTNIGIPREDHDRVLIEIMLMAEEARRMGVAVDREAVKAFLRQLSSPELAEGDWLEIARTSIGNSGYMTVEQLFEHLAYELLAQHAERLSGAGMFAIPPGAMWDYFNRLNRRVSIEAYPVDVEPLIKEVKKEPTQAELNALFEEGKYRDPNPDLPDPGFRKTHRVAFTWVKVDFGPFLEAAKKQITEEQIAEQYQKDIAQGLHKVLELPKDKPADKPAEEKKEGTPGEEPKKEGEKPGEEKKGDEKPADAKPADAKPDDAKPADAKPGEPSPEGGRAKADSPPGNEDGCQAPPVTDEKPTEKPADKAGETKPAADKPAETPPADAKPGEEKPADAKPAEEPKFKPLSEVHDEIQRKLAQPIAQEAKTKAVKEITDAISAYGRKFRRYESVKEFKKTSVEDPGKLDLTALVTKHGFQLGTTPLVDEYEVRNYEIGKNVSSLDMAAIQRGNFRMQSFSEIAFGENDTLYEPHEGTAMIPDVSYVYFRTAEEKGGDVKLEDVKEVVVREWKKQRAFELATTDAENLAKKVAGDKSLREVVGDPTKVVTPPPFSWMTTGAMAMGFGAPELGQVPGVELAGQEFMRAVFALKPNQAGAAPNQSHNKVYVVRVLGQDPSDEILRTQFLETGLNFQVVSIAQDDLRQVRIDAYKEIEKKYRVEWHRPPRPGSRMGM